MTLTIKHIYPESVQSILVDHGKKLDAILALLTKNEKETLATMALVKVDSTQIDAVNAKLDLLTTDTSKALADIKAELDAAASATADPTAAAALSSAAAKVDALDASIKAADPGPITPQPAA